MEDSLSNMPDFNDLLFESRNKDYGAYQLRKRYNSVVIAGIIISSLLISIAVIVPFILSTDSENTLSGGLRYVQVQMENLEPPVDEIFVPPTPPPPEAPRMEEIVKYIPPVVVDTLFKVEKQQLIAEEWLEQSTVQDIEKIGSGIGDDLFPGADGTETDEPFFFVEVMPSFRGGDINKFREWVQKRTNYPQLAVERRIQGKVFLTFIIEPTGVLSNVTVVQGVDPIIDNEAVKSIQASPKWSPGLQRGKPVRVRFSMYLNFVP